MTQAAAQTQPATAGLPSGSDAFHLLPLLVDALSGQGDVSIYERDGELYVVETVSVPAKPAAMTPLTRGSAQTAHGL